MGAFCFLEKNESTVFILPKLKDTQFSLKEAFICASSHHSSHDGRGFPAGSTVTPAQSDFPAVFVQTRPELILVLAGMGHHAGHALGIGRVAAIILGGPKLASGSPPKPNLLRDNHLLPDSLGQIRDSGDVA